MTSFVTAKYGSDKNQIYDPNSAGTPVTATTNPVTGGIELIGPDGEVIEVGSDTTRSGIVSVMPWGNYAYQRGSINRTMQVNIGVKKTSFYGVRIGFMNTDTATTQTVFAKVAPCPTLLNDGSTLAFVGVTFNGAATVVIPVATLSSAAEVIPSIVYSDVIPVQSISRTDTPGDWPLLCLRVHDLNTVGITFTGVDDSLAHVQALGIPLAATTSSVGDKVTTTTTGIAVFSTPGSKVLPAVSFDFFTGEKSCKIALFGASQSATNSFSYRLVKEVENAGKVGASIANYSCGGQGIYHQSGVLRAVCSATKPDMALFWSITVNSAYMDQASQDLQFKQVYEDVLWCKGQGIKPVILVRWADSSAGALLLNYRLRFIAAMTDVCTLIDVGGAVSDPADMKEIRADLTSDGTTHLNDAGYAVLAAYAGPVLAALI